METAATALGVRPGASTDEVRKAFHRVALRCHPDKVCADEKEAASAKFRMAHHAYELLLSGAQGGARTSAASSAASSTATGAASKTADSATSNVSGSGVAIASVSKTTAQVCTECGSAEKVMWMGCGMYMCPRCRQMAMDSIRSATSKIIRPTSQKDCWHQKQDVQRRAKGGRGRDRHGKQHAQQPSKGYAAKGRHKGKW